MAAQQYQAGGKIVPRSSLGGHGHISFLCTAYQAWKGIEEAEETNVYVLHQDKILHTLFTSARCGCTNLSNLSILVDFLSVVSFRSGEKAIMNIMEVHEFVF